MSLGFFLEQLDIAPADNSLVIFLHQIKCMRSQLYTVYRLNNDDDDVEQVIYQWN